MGIFGNLFGRKPKGQPYVDAGMALSFKLCRSLDLADWNEGLPTYTQEEQEAIDRHLSMFQTMANREMGDEAAFHPDVAPVIQRHVAGQALEDLAATQWRLIRDSAEVPASWKTLVSTFLKAWVAQLNPQILLELGEVLVKAKHKDQAKEVFHAVLLFPTYAKTLWGKDDAELLQGIIGQAKEALKRLN